MSIDPRLVERRRTVAEDNAKRNVGRLLKFLVASIVVGALVWLVFSPWLSVSQVDTTGITTSSGHSILVERSVVAGTPMIRISASGTEAALLEDPWIAEADVTIDWPDRVAVTIVERTPAAWTRTAEGWTRRAVDGVALPSGSEPDPDLAWIDMPELGSGEAAPPTDLLGALEFVDTLPSDLRPGTVVFHHEGEIWATVSGHQVRLGRGVDMAAKALSLDALLAEDLPEDAVVVLIAPTNPAYTTPRSRDTADEETTGGEIEPDADRQGTDEEGGEDGGAEPDE